MIQKLEKIIPHSEEWNILAGKVAMNFCPPIYPCAKCNHPVISGYCCIFCNDNSPEITEEEEKIFRKSKIEWVKNHSNK